jgi:hypothetical protein
MLVMSLAYWFCKYDEPCHFPQLGAAAKTGARTDLAVPVVVRQQLLPRLLIQRALRVRVDQQALDGLDLSAPSCS